MTSTASAIANTAATLSALLPPHQRGPHLFALANPPSPLDSIEDSHLLTQWFLWLLTGPDTPLTPWQHHHLTIRTADLLQRTLKNTDPHPQIWLGIAHQTRQLINSHSKPPPINLPHTTKADLHFAGVLSSISHHTGATAFLHSTNHFWPLC